MFHTEEQQLKLGQLLADEVIRYARHCEHDEHEPQMKCYEVKMLEAIALQLKSDPLKGHELNIELTSEYIE